MLDAARRAKHFAFVAGKRARRRLRRANFDAATVVFRHAGRVRRYRYESSRYAGTFLERTIDPGGVREFPRQVFVVWAGDNPLSGNRARSLEAIRAKVGLPVHFVTPDTLDEWVVPGHPPHPAYEHLSLVHRSDYLRGYLMHHHGGGYVDVKEPLGSWEASFYAMGADPEAWVTSYHTSHANWIGKLRGRLGRDILVNYRLMFGKGSLLMRSHTPLTAEWLAEMEARMDAVAGALERHPGGVYGDDPYYPLSWTDLLGRVLDPLTLKYQQHVRFDDRLLLHFKDYR